MCFFSSFYVVFSVTTKDAGYLCCVRSRLWRALARFIFVIVCDLHCSRFLGRWRFTWLSFYGVYYYAQANNAKLDKSTSTHCTKKIAWSGNVIICVLPPKKKRHRLQPQLQAHTWTSCLLDMKCNLRKKFITFYAHARTFIRMIWYVHASAQGCHAYWQTYAVDRRATLLHM